MTRAGFPANAKMVLVFRSPGWRLKVGAWIRKGMRVSKIERAYTFLTMISLPYPPQQNESHTLPSRRERDLILRKLRHRSEKHKSLLYLETVDKNLVRPVQGRPFSLRLTCRDENGPRYDGSVLRAKRGSRCRCSRKRASIHPSQWDLPTEVDSPIATFFRVYFKNLGS